MDLTWREVQGRGEPPAEIQIRPLPAAAAPADGAAPVVGDAGAAADGPSCATPGVEGTGQPQQQQQQEGDAAAPAARPAAPAAVGGSMARGQHRDPLAVPARVLEARRAVLSSPVVWPVVCAVARLPSAPGPRPGVRVQWDDDNAPIYVLMALAARRALESARDVDDVQLGPVAVPAATASS